VRGQKILTQTEDDMETNKFRTILAWIKSFLTQLEGTQDSEMAWRRWEYLEYKKYDGGLAKGFEDGRFF